MLFTAFGNPFLSTALNQPIATLPHTLFVYAISPYADWRAKAWGTALVLVVPMSTATMRSGTLPAPDEIAAVRHPSAPHWGGCCRSPAQGTDASHPA